MTMTGNGAVFGGGLARDLIAIGFGAALQGYIETVVQPAVFSS